MSTPMNAFLVVEHSGLEVAQEALAIEAAKYEDT